MKKKHLLGFQIFIILVSFLLVLGCGKATDEWVIASDTTKTVDATTQLSKLTIEDNANLTAPDGYRLTLTVDGVETGQVLETWEGVDYKFAPGSYQGDIVLTVAEANDVFWSMGRELGMREGGEGDSARGPQDRSESLYPFRQALYLNADGIVDAKSVLAAVQDQPVTEEAAQSMAAMQANQQLRELTAAGFIRLEGDHYKTTARFEGGKLFVNGQEIPLMPPTGLDGGAPGDDLPGESARP